MSVDPAAESFSGLSPYNYGLNNPIRVIDPDGAFAVTFTGEAAQNYFRQLQSDYNSQGGNCCGDPPTPSVAGILFEAGLNIGNAAYNMSQRIKEFFTPGKEEIVKRRRLKTDDWGGVYGAEVRYEAAKSTLAEVADAGLDALSLTPLTELGVAGRGMSAPFLAARTGGGLITVGRWMSKTEYDNMIKTGVIQEGAGGQTFAATSGPGSFRKQASKGSVYVEFDVDQKSLLQGGQLDWVKAIGPNAGRAMQAKVAKQGGTISPSVHNVSNILEIKK